MRISNFILISLYGIAVVVIQTVFFWKIVIPEVQLNLILAISVFLALKRPMVFGWIQVVFLSYLMDVSSVAPNGTWIFLNSTFYMLTFIFKQKFVVSQTSVQFILLFFIYMGQFILQLFILYVFADFKPAYYHNALFIGLNALVNTIAAPIALIGLQMIDKISFESSIEKSSAEEFLFKSSWWRI